MKTPRVIEFRVRSAETQHISALTDRWLPATVARIVEEVRTLAALRDPTAILEVRWRRLVERAERRRGAA
jgi:hypothetical protein